MMDPDHGDVGLKGIITLTSHCPSRRLRTVGSGRPDRLHRSQDGGVRRTSLERNSGNASPWNTAFYPRRGRSGGNRSAPSETWTSKVQKSV
jgi:hypothetical protein